MSSPSRFGFPRRRPSPAWPASDLDPLYYHDRSNKALLHALFPSHGDPYRPSLAPHSLHPPFSTLLHVESLACCALCSVSVLIFNCDVQSETPSRATVESAFMMRDVASNLGYV
ncbi:hypothetical protein HETIRDRAFT_459077 [Heterobasidion irregulare TC 32-1]|uniref:Uncharacterized protein n=1 Tax=Heterobasidion irregulare (strain TC 32-1) TaxID=747525 RepID=W4K7U2_HETIT|nr:uncharacterized protein HETIRDRAFT_459062 [Heterobasidion irregulare TC 32-1]XP_009546521.1 uncharacterized protein HETIRDRAFT_459077 [Heterobasidion irregulare TC 32-1]ETW81892.1 hypothetical protein HETIRDRAFT_459062 [Heterobasidion irregulare TC 32-1]ETW81931.1 hypothetical protein HETIRDRAFT_459077 [Heterobasidion irregulare TC 32-1]